ncbi:MAG: hypothetical protein AB203_03500 [Parcubacteria bacterium C7867-008]|nr:MAG: hypothetical protein AB203_03500 [Parcubacteria bacterium C7867-008]
MGETQKRGGTRPTPEEVSAVRAKAGRSVRPENRAFARDRDLAARASAASQISRRLRMMANP